MIKTLFLTCSLALLAFTSHASTLEEAQKIIAESQEVSNINGHKIDIIVPPDDYQKALMIDGKEILKDQYVDLQSKHNVGNDTILFGSTQDGGNSCLGNSFLVVLNQDQDPKLFGPLESCAIESFEINDNSVTYRTIESRSSGFDTWEWTYEKGFVYTGNTPFKPNDETGWSAVKHKLIDIPSDALNNVEIHNSIKTLLGKDYKTFADIIDGTASGKYAGGKYRGYSCTPHMCSEQEAILFLDPTTDKVYAAFREDGKKAKIFPNEKSWPKYFKTDLKKWSSRFK